MAEHITEVVRTTFRPDHWIVRCSCGYRSDLFPRQLDAAMHADEHLEQSPRTEWADRPQFAEPAEALGVPTDQIMAATTRGLYLLVIYNPEPYEEGSDQEIWTAMLTPDRESGILRVVARQKSDLTWAKIEAKIKADVQRAFGEIEENERRGMEEDG